ncbi:MAG TPA: hypothetical protein PLQ19_02630 [Aeromicrobium sp.]|nr:hypothetical protein [Aeromicrobium sp.]
MKNLLLLADTFLVLAKLARLVGPSEVVSGTALIRVYVAAGQLGSQRDWFNFLDRSITDRARTYLAYSPRMDQAFPSTQLALHERHGSFAASR